MSQSLAISRHQNRSSVAGASQKSGLAQGRTRRSPVWLKIAALFVVAFVALAVMGVASSQASTSELSVGVSSAYPVEVVQSGDSLWSIAQRVSGNEDPRAVVSRIQELNDIELTILQPGQVIRVG